MKKVFFYGLFMDEELLSEGGLHPQNAQIVTVDGYGLRIGERASLEVSETESCYGTVIELAEDELVELYSGAGVEDYRPQAVTATLSGGERIEVVSYLLPAELMSGSNSGYADKLAAIARKLALPDDYILEIESWI